MLSKIIAVVAAAGALSACASRGGSAGADAYSSSVPHATMTTQATGTTYMGPAMTTIRYPEMGITIDPPAAATPSVSWQNAVDLCSSGQATCADKTPSTVVLGLVSTPNSARMQPDGSAQPTITRRLAYVLTWPDATCVPAGPAGGSPTPTTCKFITLVDAITGKYMAAADTTAPTG